jgi:tetratricopeptide (TPR) repeat protein/transglutaminase-like putative cysteine protease
MPQPLSKCLRVLICCASSLVPFANSSCQSLPNPSNPKSVDPKPDHSAEPFIIEQDNTKVVFENDGSYCRETTSRIRIQSVAAIQRFGVFTLQYQKSAETLDVEFARVRKPDGSVVDTPSQNVQDMPSEVTRQAPLYSDLYEKHVAIRGLGVGDVLEVHSVWRSIQPFAPGQFWFAYNFSRDILVLQEQLQISVPAARAVKWKSTKLRPTIVEDHGRRIFSWNNSQLEHQSTAEEKENQERAAYQSVRGKASSPEIQISSFQSWEEVGRWYNSLQADRIKPTPEIRAKANALTADSPDNDAKVRDIYKYVSTQFRYIGIDFGIGRYQPHSAADVLSNQYGDCKDKHTLLASLLDAVGIKAYPALINSAHEIDVDVPSPGQFDHVISVVSQGDHLTWLDTTPELAPFAYLLSGLRDKEALAIPGDKPAALIATSPDPPRPALVSFRIQAKLDDTGTLTGKIARSIQGDDNEVVVRIAFRTVPAPQWKELIQRISYVSGFAGDVSETTAGQPENIDEPFPFAYNYSRKDYPDWSDRRISPPLPPIGLPAGPDDDRPPSYPIWLGSPSQAHFESQVELPEGYNPQLPKNVDLMEDFGEYHASYTLKDGALVTDRRLILKLREVPVEKYPAYKKFRKAVSDDHELLIALSSGGSSTASYQDEIWNLPYSENPEAARAYDQAREDYQKQNFAGQISSLTDALEIDPQFIRAWLWLGEIYKYRGQTDDALRCYRKAMAVDPQLPVTYKALASTLLWMENFDAAIPVWQDLIKLVPNDSAGPTGLAAALLGLKRNAEAVAAFEAAVKLNPRSPDLFARLGSAYLAAGESDKALLAYQKALELDSSPLMFNDVGYFLADANKSLPLALQYSQKAVAAEEDKSQKINLADLRTEDLSRATALSAYWDTLGWVHFRMGNFDQAEKYLDSAWKLSLSGAIADHLGQLYEQQHKKQAAIHMYRLALYSYSSRTPHVGDETRKRLERLSPGISDSRQRLVNLSDEINSIRTVRLPRVVPGTAHADFFLVFTRDAKSSLAQVEEVKFIDGSEDLKSASTTWRSIISKIAIPGDGHPHILRRGTLGCYPESGCSFTLFLPRDVHSLN